MEAVWLRLFHPYGPMEPVGRLVPTVVRSLLERTRVQVTPGDQVRDFIHVADVASAVEAVAGSDLTGVVNVGVGQPRTVRDMLTLIGENLDAVDLIDFGARPHREGDPMFVCANSERLRRGTGWLPRHTLEEGIADTIEWWRRHPDRT